VPAASRKRAMKKPNPDERATRKRPKGAPYPDELWREIRWHYERGSRSAELSRQFNIARSTLATRIIRENWQRHDADDPYRPQMLLARLRRVLERQIKEAEAGSETDDKLARTLSSLARTLEKIEELGGTLERTTDAAEAGPSDDELRAELERRLHRLAAAAATTNVSRKSEHG